MSRIGRLPTRGRVYFGFWFFTLLYVSGQAIHFEICNSWSEGLVGVETGMKSNHDARQGVLS